MSDIHRFILSYPRSGNTLTRGIVEYLTERPTAGCIGNPMDTPICQWVRLKESENLLRHVKGPYLYIKSHGLYDFDGRKPGKMVFLLRDFREVIVRNCQGRDVSDAGFNLKAYLPQMKQYMELIRIYINSDCPKICLYYEDLMTEPLEFVKKLHQFLGEDSHEKRYQELLQNFNELSNMIAFKNKAPNHDGVISQMQTKFYFNQLNQDNRDKFNSAFFEMVNNPDNHYYKELKYIMQYL